MSEKIYLVILFLSLNFGFSQNFDSNWKKVYQYELDGKIETAQKEVESIYKKAKRKKEDVTIVKCFFYLSKFEQVFDENAQTTIISNLRKEIKEASKENKAILNYIYAKILTDYYNNKKYQIAKRTKLENNVSEDFLTWTSEDFENKIDLAFENSLENRKSLMNIYINDLKEIFETSPYSNNKEISVYAFLLEKYSDHISKKISQWDYKNQLDIKKFNDTGLYDYNLSNYYDLNRIEHPEVKKVIELYISQEQYYRINEMDNIRDNYYIERIKFLYRLKKSILYFDNIKQLENRTKDEYLKQDLRLQRANFYYSQTHKSSKENLYHNALALIDSILNAKANLNTLSNAEKLKNLIIGKSLSIEIKNKIYSNENTRAYLRYKNIDSITINYYKFPVEVERKLNSYGSSKKDSLYIDYITKNKAIKRFTRKVLNKKDYFEYSTEILLGKLETGNYLLFIESNNNSDNKNIAYSFSKITVSNIGVLKDKDLANDLFYFYDNKTGKPLENVIVRNNEESVISDKNGKAIIRKRAYNPKNNYDRSEIYYIKENDTIFENYNKGYLVLNSDEYDDRNFEAKAMVYFDRAIYRPGQKVFFKAILIQNKKNKKSVVPFVSIRVIINGANDTVLKEYDIQTNEFGSIFGEFEIPKNIVTGEFYITIDEAENYEIDTEYYDSENEEHKFWDNVTYRNYTEFRFHVEEYKRPTFEINFSKITENYKVGDTIKIKGNAKSLAGNSLTNAKVVYEISNQVYKKNNGYSGDNNFKSKEIQTNENGDFVIEFLANDSLLDLNQIFRLDYTINVTITDINGETREAETFLKVGLETLSLTSYISEELKIEEKNNLRIETTTLNNHPINAKGKIEVYYYEKKSFLKNREFSFPEIQTIEREEFNKLFPFEPYDKTDTESKQILIKTIDFDTKLTNDTNLDFLTKEKLGDYYLLISSEDDNGNLIKNHKYFKLKSSKSPFLNEQLFSYVDKTKEGSDFFEIEIRSIIQDLYIISRFYDDQLIVKEQTIQLINGKGVFKINKKNEYKNDVSFHFSSFWENKFVSTFFSIKKEIISPRINIEIQSLKNKIEPGSVQNWSFKILNSKLEAEVLASMYDSSLDQFVEKNWEDIYHYNQTNYPAFPRFYNEDKEYLYFRNFNFALKYPDYENKFNTEINTFGFDFNTVYNVYLNKKYLKSIKGKTNIPKNAKIITGNVSDELGTLAGATVVVKGTIRGITTDFDGNFEIEAKAGEVLEVSFAGKKKNTFIIGSKRQYDVILEGGFVGDQIVLTGIIGVSRRVDAVTSSYQIIKHEEINQAANENAVQALAGKVSGLQINTTSDGKTKSIVLRGSRSITGNNEALIIIDGTISTANNLQTLNSNSILEMRVIKGGEGAALYGDKGANGVIVVSTKKGFQELANVKTRTSFKETAFFYPNLKTDKDGKISFEFKTPESLTRWNFRLYAHNKNAETGYFQTDIISQKDVMVQTNMPRFVREKDEIKISAKVVNMTSEIKTGIAMLQLYDATTNTVIDEICSNKDNVKNFSCKAKESVPVEWIIKIPEGLQGLQYKIVAKSGNFSDGEENILPVLSNKVLLTESIPIWVKGETKKEYEFLNLKNNSSKTLKNHLFTLEYTSNPTWLALQSLPYLMEYEHECAEQTFSKYYANYIATQIIDSNPKVASLFETWKQEGNLTSKLNMNDELKSIVLAETPWLLDAQNEESKNKRLALLMDLNTMKESMESTLKKLKEKQNPSGAFSWFDGGDDNLYITQHIVKGLGHLGKLFPEKDSIYNSVAEKAIPYLDQKYISNSSLKNQRINYYTYSNLHYLYARSFYVEKQPVSKKIDSIINIQKVEFKKDWLTYNLYSKALLSLTMYRFGDKTFAKKILTNLKESAARNEDNGMYWIENTNGYNWYQSSIETQAMLIEAFTEIENDDKIVDELKVWLLKNKQVNKWSTTKSTTEAVYALLLQGSDWTPLKDNTKFTIGNEKIFTKKLSEKVKEAETGYIKVNWKADEFTKEMGIIKVDNKSKVPGYGGVYWQYFENLENIKTDSTKTLYITKTLYKKVKTSKGNELIEMNKESLKTGDLITIRLVLKTESDLEFVHLKDLRASCFEPVDVISNYEWKDNLSYYKSTKDVATHFFFDKINKGTYVLEYDVRINNSGNFNDGIATLQSMYAPEFSAHSTSTTIKVD